MEYNKNKTLSFKCSAKLYELIMDTYNKFDNVTISDIIREAIKEGISIISNKIE